MFVNFGAAATSLVGGIGILGALIVLATVVAEDADRHDLRGGQGLYWPLVFVLAPIGLLVWLAGTFRKVDHDQALIRSFAVGVFNIVYAAALVESMAADWP